MSPWQLIGRSLRYNARAHVAVGLAVAVCTAVITGALLVGDSVRASLLRLVTLRLGRTTLAVTCGDRLVPASLGERLGTALGVPAAPIILTPGSASAPDRGLRLPRLQVVGVDERFAAVAGEGAFPLPSGDEAVLSANAAARLRLQPGETLLVRTEKRTALPRETPLARADEGRLVLRLTVKAVVGDEGLGRFSLRAENLAPFNVFVSREAIARGLGLAGRANAILLAGGEALTAPEVTAALQAAWTLADVGLTVQPLPQGGTELRSERVFLDPAVGNAAASLPGANPVLTYFANDLRVGERSTPYSFVAGLDAPWLTPALGDGDMAISQWLADDLGCRAGDRLTLAYYAVGPLRALEERRAEFTVRQVLPMELPSADRDLMPDIPGLADAERCGEWDPGIPVDLKRVRKQDEAYWQRWRGTPKAFVPLATAQRLWSNRFGNATAIRFTGGLAPAAVAERLRAGLRVGDLGLAVEPVFAAGRQASQASQDFAQLFLGLSFFLILAALGLTGLLFGLFVDRRRSQIGTLRACGFTPARARWLLLAEGGAVALCGAALGGGLGLLYNQLVIMALTGVWRDSVGAAPLVAQASARSLCLGPFCGLVVALGTLWLVLGRTRRLSVQALHSGAAAVLRPCRARVAAIGLCLLAVGIGLALTGHPGRGKEAAAVFFGAGGLLLAGLLVLGHTGLGWLTRIPGSGLGLRNASRRPGRSLAVAGLLACSLFLVVAVGANRHDPAAATAGRASGTGGFAFFGELSLPLLADLNTPEGRAGIGLQTDALAGLRAVGMTLSEGDDASCLNLNRSSRPRLLGVDPAELAARNAFTFVRMAPGLDQADPWSGLAPTGSEDTLPAVADETTIVWGLGLKVGDRLTLRDGRGKDLTLRFVGGLAGSVLQGHVLISATAFARYFPGEGGVRVLLLDVPEAERVQAATLLPERLADAGLVLTPCQERLAAFGAVENTYLAIFLGLGGLALVLGSAGLWAVVMRNVEERRGELALLRAVGFSRWRVGLAVVAEHGALLLAGLGTGALAGLLAVLPALLAPGDRASLSGVALWIGLILASGLAWIGLAAGSATRGDLAQALRDE